MKPDCMTAKMLELAYTTAAILNMQVSGVNVSNSVSGFILHDFISVNTYFFLAICQDGDVRLSGGRNPSEGQVEICFNNQWGRICPNSWDVADAAVVCTQLGLPSDSKLANSVSVYSINERVDIWFCFEGAVATTFGQGIGPIYLDGVTCIGNETSLAECEHQGVSSHDCSYSLDAGVICPGEYYIPPPHLPLPQHTKKQAL